MRALWLVLGLSLSGGAAGAAQLVPEGRFIWDGAGAEGFGGFSGLVVTDGGSGMLAVSDRGPIWDVRIRRDASGHVEALETRSIIAPLNSEGRPQTAFQADAEALSTGQDGRTYVAYEGLARIMIYDLPDTHPRATDRWDRFRPLWGNESFEALATLPDGRLLAVIETADGNGVYTSYVLGPDGWQDGPRLTGAQGYSAAGADVGSDGRLYLLERWYGFGRGFATRVRRFSPSASGFDRGEVLLETAPGDFDNMEGISLWRRADGAVMLTLISDDNFSWSQRTEIAEFRLEE